MTLPNKLTLLRILLIPVMVIIYYIPKLHEINVGIYSLAILLIAVIFIIASLTDMLDGMIARKYNLITTFGKFADPLADKMLVFAAMLILMDMGSISLWIVVAILIREFMVSGIRMMVAERAVVIPAGNLGKLKTITTMVALVILLFVQFNDGVTMGLTHNIMYYTGHTFMYLAVFLTIVSGIEYLYRSKNVVFETM